MISYFLPVIVIFNVIIINSYGDVFDTLIFSFHYY